MIRLTYKVEHSLWTETQFLALLSILEKYPFPKPNLASKTYQKKWKVFSITHFKDENLLKALILVKRRASDYRVMIDNASEEHLNLLFTQGSDTILLMDRFSPFLTSKQIKALFYDLIKVNHCENGFCRIFEDRIYVKHFTHKDTFSKIMLGWLQYFGKETLMRVGGIAAFESNPYLQTERIHDGLFVEVGDDPSIFDTPEGEQLLVNAINALPLIQP